MPLCLAVVSLLRVMTGCSRVCKLRCRAGPSGNAAAIAALPAAGGVQCHRLCRRDRLGGGLSFMVPQSRLQPVAERSTAGPRGCGDSVACRASAGPGWRRLRSLLFGQESGQRWTCEVARWEGALLPQRGLQVSLKSTSGFGERRSCCQRWWLTSASLA